MALSTAGYNRLIEAPDDWQEMPIHGDSRPNAPLERDGYIEVRRTTTRQHGPISFVRVDWRITDAGKAAIAKTLEKAGYVLVDGEWVPKSSRKPSS